MPDTYVTVTMHFGDGTYKYIEMDVEPGETREDVEAKTDSWVQDNAWFEVNPDQDWPGAED